MYIRTDVYFYIFIFIIIQKKINTSTMGLGEWNVDKSADVFCGKWSNLD